MDGGRGRGVVRSGERGGGMSRCSCVRPLRLFMFYLMFTSEYFVKYYVQFNP
jgi:hypothetical protein